MKNEVFNLNHGNQVHDKNIQVYLKQSGDNQIVYPLLVNKKNKDYLANDLIEDKQ